MFKLTALFTTLALGASASIAMASPARIPDRRTAVAYTRTARHARGPARIGAFDRGVRPDQIGWRRGPALDDFGARRYRPTWVALDAPRPFAGGRECIEVRDPGTFTQLRLQSEAGFAAIGRVIVQFADGTDQVADLRRELDRRGEFVELPLDGNNRRIARIIVTGALGDLQVFAI